MYSLALYALALLFLTSCGQCPDVSTIEEADATAPTGDPIVGVSIKELMESVVVPASNRLWGAEDPQTDEEWRVLEDAAVTVISAGSVMSLGGSGPRASDWAQNPAWKALTVEMTEAAIDSLKAIRASDIDALYEAGYRMYPPCENCHMQFNPSVTGQ